MHVSYSDIALLKALQGCQRKHGYTCWLLCAKFNFWSSCTLGIIPHIVFIPWLIVWTSWLLYGWFSWSKILFSYKYIRYLHVRFMAFNIQVPYSSAIDFTFDPLYSVGSYCSPSRLYIFGYRCLLLCSAAWEGEIGRAHV